MRDDEIIITFPDGSRFSVDIGIMTLDPEDAWKTVMRLHGRYTENRSSTEWPLTDPSVAWASAAYDLYSRLSPREQGLDEVRDAIRELMQLTWPVDWRGHHLGSDEQIAEMVFWTIAKVAYPKMIV